MSIGKAVIIIVCKSLHNLFYDVSGGGLNQQLSEAMVREFRSALYDHVLRPQGVSGTSVTPDRAAPVRFAASKRDDTRLHFHHKH